MSNPKYKATEKIRWVANRIYTKFHLSKGGNFVVYTIDDNEQDKTAPSYYDQTDILEKMEWKKALKIHKAKFKPDLSKSGDESRPNHFKLEILQPKFDELFERQMTESGFVAKSSKDATPELAVKKLALFNDGTIRYDGEIIPLRMQLKSLCTLFLRKPNRLIEYEEIKNEIIRADRRTSVSYKTISKYISELNSSLEIRFGKKIFFNSKGEGWYFRP